MKRQINVKVRGKWHTVEVDEPQGYPFEVTIDGEVLEVEVEVDVTPGVAPSVAPRPTPAETAGPVGLSAMTQEDEKLIRSPMPGHIVAVSVAVWSEVAPGTEVCVLETMKMEQSIHVSQSGIVRAVFIHPGQNVTAGAPLIQLE